MLACGGIPHSKVWQTRLFSEAPGRSGHWSAAPSSNTGDGLSLGIGAGGTIEDDLSNAAAWVPVSQVPRRDGTFCNFPHLVDRGRPGVIAVSNNGKRFVSESRSYHDFMQALFNVTGTGEEVSAYLICDARAQRRFGLGFAKPFPFPLRPYLKSGYLKHGRTLKELATQINVPANTLCETVAAFNAAAERGEDPAFQRGSTVYQRFMGDEAHGPNPSLAPLLRAPFYAVKVIPGSLGTFSGLRTDQRARVLAQDNQPVKGLYAEGNDMASMMRGNYPAGGITLGPALTFGYIAGLDLADKLDD